MRVGVLALQGDVREHLELLRGLDVAAEPVRSSAEIDALDALVIPGGESTTLGLLLSDHQIMDPVSKRIEAGLPVLGTCAGLILLAREVTGGPVPGLGLLDVSVQRNAYGRQTDSFEARIDVDAVGTVGAVFIRAPVITRTGAGVDTLARHDDAPVVVRQGNVWACTFHPELAGETGLHRAFLDAVTST